MKIFIVEDDLVIAESLANELSKWNYEVHVVDNFEKIMEDFRRVEPQLVLLDINLPTLNGFHWCQEMRKVSHVPIKFISSRTYNMWLEFSYILFLDWLRLDTRLFSHTLSYP